MRSSIVLAAAALSSLTSAQSTISLFIPDSYDETSVVASQIKSDATATTYYVGCPTGGSYSDCWFPYPFTMTQGPSTVDYAFGIPDSVTYSFRCVIEGTTSISFFRSVSGPDVPSSDLVSTSSTLSVDDLNSYFIPVTLVNNANAITTYDQRTITYDDDSPSSAASNGASPIANAGSALTTSGASQTTSSSGPASTTTATSSTGGGSGSSSGSVTGTGSGAAAATASASKSSTGGVPHVTGNAGWVVGGMAAAVAIAGL